MSIDDQPVSPLSGLPHVPLPDAVAWLAGFTPRRIYPAAADPVASVLADLCAYVVALGWWAMPLETIVWFRRRLRHPDR